MIYYAMPFNKYLLAKWIQYNVNPFNFVLLVMQGKSQQSVYFIISCKCKITNHQYGLVHNPLYPFLFFYFLDNIYPPFSHQSTQSHVFIYIFACLDNNNKLRILFVLLFFCPSKYSIFCYTFVLLHVLFWFPYTGSML